MALSEQEQRLLDEMERHLYQNEADVMSTAPRSAQTVSTRSIVLAILAVAVGLGIVMVGLSFQQPVIGIAGFVVMLLGVLLAFRRGNRKAGTESGSGDDVPTATTAKGSNATKGGATGGATAQGGGFMDRLEDRWDRRRNGD
ncbi:hypothetical protein GCM10011490_01980 [Pseudoclavibacter endophyticus]|uniref:DUF3040 domain-containing protein n=1 Tax=Pseudoclavibacter endophyticus TaxID=1778590 RepID=A0A6H9WH21_9MICO|nr:DUF3040 domain-containing protein [Pseudoclavibacter endophyticus]KAB1650259.1 DUF3040 domain-containing protein [Pseudoclavibacter endophyticus]GGA55752.1 hypothetical protein GCM10011490_01980 [Pseudoclavibacter endophyticus]